MQKRRVLLVCSPDLFGEGMEKVLRAAEDVELIGPCRFEDGLFEQIAQSDPHVVIIVDAGPQSDAVAHLVTALIEQCPRVPVICAGLNENVVRVFTTHLFPARGDALLESIRDLPAWEDCLSDERKV